MIRKLRTQRDDQQWMLDLALNMRGRVQNLLGRAANGRDERLAQQSQGTGS